MILVLVNITSYYLSIWCDFFYPSPVIGQSEFAPHQYVRSIRFGRPALGRAGEIEKVILNFSAVDDVDAKFITRRDVGKTIYVTKRNYRCEW